MPGRPDPQELSLLDLDLGLPSLQNCGKRNFYGLSHAICHSLLQQAREVNTDSKTGLGISVFHPGGLGEAGVIIIHSANTGVSQTPGTVVGAGIQP